MQLALGYWRSQVLFTALDLGLFEALGEGPRKAADLAARTGASPSHLAMLLNAAAAIGLVQRNGDQFLNSPMVERFLLEGSPESMTEWVRFMARCYEPWGGLGDTVKGGRPVSVMRPDLEAAPTRSLILAMRDWARGPGSELVRHLDLSGRKRLLDVGAGPGTYSVLLAERWPGLSAECLDLPAVVPITREVIAASAAAARVSARPGSYLTDDFGSGFDVVLMSNMLHQEDRDTVVRILRKAAAALVPGGLLVVQSAFLDPDTGAGTWAALMSLQLSLFYEGGRNYSLDEMQALIREAGFADLRVRRMSLINSDSLILATKEPTSHP
jgi:SAM-dependent methyltransferase